MTGCVMNNDPLVLEMEAAYQMPSTSSTESNKHVAERVRQHFPRGTRVREALNEIYENGFVITENKREGYRQWPDGDVLMPYKLPEVRQSMGRRLGEHKNNYFASLTYWVSPLEKRKITLYLETENEVIVEAGGAIYIYTL